MAEQPNEEPTVEPTEEAVRDRTGGIGPGALATAGLALIALAILLYFVYPRFTGDDESMPRTPGTVVASLVTATPAAATPTTEPDAAAPTPEASEATEAATGAPMVTEPPGSSPSPTREPATATVPVQVAEGAYAQVAGTDELGLRMRSGPGADFVTWRILPEGEVLLVTGGPEPDGEVVWWRVMDQTGLVGWVAEQFLVPVPAPDWTPEPERTPDVTELPATPDS
jgi:hypothetical protein